MRTKKADAAKKGIVEGKGIASKVTGLKKKMFPIMAGATMLFMNINCTVFASGTGSVTAPLDNLKTLVISVIGAVGVIIIAKNVMEFAQAYQQQEISSMNSALKGMAAGAIMAAITPVMAFLGF